MAWYNVENWLKKFFVDVFWLILVFFALYGFSVIFHPGLPIFVMLWIAGSAAYSATARF
jgi:hypothetical protein